MGSDRATDANAGAGRTSGLEPDLTAKAGGAILHAAQPKTAAVCPAMLQTHAIVSDRHCHFFGRAVDDDAHAPCLRMARGVSDGFLGDPVQLCGARGWQ